MFNQNPFDNNTPQSNNSNSSAVPNNASADTELDPYPYQPPQTQYPPQGYQNVQYPPQTFYGPNGVAYGYPPPNYYYPRRSRKVVAAVIILQSIPMLGAAGCTAQAASNQSSSGWFLLWFAAFLWGFGYAYLGRWTRFGFAFIGGGLLNFFLPWILFSGVNFPDFEHGFNTNTDYTNANLVCLEMAVILATVCLFTIIDAWRVAVAHNALVDIEEKQYSQRFTPPGQPT